MADTEQVAFRMIAASGAARGMYVEAVHLAEEGKFDEAQQKLDEGEKTYVEGHKAHAELLTSMANGEQVVMDILMVHAEDQMMATETYRMCADEIIALCHKLAEKN